MERNATIEHLCSMNQKKEKEIREAYQHVYDTLMQDKGFVDIVRCRDNSNSDVFDLFRDKVNTILLDSIDFSKDSTECMHIYNILTDNKVYRFGWICELFDAIADEIRG